jgi:hypothetical protein
MKRNVVVPQAREFNMTTGPQQGTITKTLLAAVLSALIPFLAGAESISIILQTNAAPRVEFGAQQLLTALKAANLDAQIARSDKATGKKIFVNRWPGLETAHEGFSFALGGNNDIGISGADDSGTLYGCLELAGRIRQAGELPTAGIVQFRDHPAMRLRGACIGMQKTYILPGRKVYEYPYTPELFPWFYDKQLWTEYLDVLAHNRMNTLYLWSGHPFGSLVRLEEYPEGVEVSADVFEKNVEMFRWLATECDRRGIWLVQMFYNIFLPKPFAEKHGLATQLSAPTPLASDYTRKAIAEFVRQYPNVGLMVCLGEALQGTANQIAWATNTILPGVLDGMRAAGLKEQPPVVIRTHAMEAELVIPACFQVYSNLFTETKYNGESLTTYEPRGKGQATHLAMAKLGPHLVNVHILANLEPFRYGAQRFIKKCVESSRDRLGACGLHLYPLAYWNWPYSPDAADPPLNQWERDWMWLTAWARYAWNSDVPEAADRAYWISRLRDAYGCDEEAAGRILEAVNDAGEVAPVLVRRFGITEGNRQTLSLGMTLDQLVNPAKYGAIPDLWLSQAPPGERLDEYTRKEWNHQPHMGETPETALQDTGVYSQRAVEAIKAAAPTVTRNTAEFKRLANDIRCVRLLWEVYSRKARAAEALLRYDLSHDLADLVRAEAETSDSLARFEVLASAAGPAYRFANSMQTGHRKIPFPGAANGAGTNYHWSQVLPLYQQELVALRARVGKAQASTDAGSRAAPTPAAWPAAKLTLLNAGGAEVYKVEVGARPFTDSGYTITGLAPELNGLNGIRFSHEAAAKGRYEPIEFEVAEPVRVLVGYFNDLHDAWRQPPNLDVAAQADERGGVDVVLQNAAAIESCSNINVHAYRFDPGRHRLELLGKGSFVVLGVVPQSARLDKRDAGIGAK